MNLGKFLRRPFYRTRPGDCFWTELLFFMTFFIIAFHIDLKIPHIRGFVACSKRALKFPVRTGCRTLTVNNHLNKHFIWNEKLGTVPTKILHMWQFFQPILYCKTRKASFESMFWFYLNSQTYQEGHGLFRIWVLRNFGRHFCTSLSKTLHLRLLGQAFF